jgi:AcrR family transcriptional regulator
MPAIFAGTARERIRDAALELMGKKGVAGTTTQEIARRAACSQAAIYKYWDSKDALAQETFEAAHRQLLEEMEAGARAGRTASDRVEGALVRFLGYARSRPTEYGFLFQVFHSDYARWLAAHPMPRDIVVRELERGMKAGEIPRGEAQLAAALVLGMAIRVAFFEKQRLLGADAAAVNDGLRRGVRAVLQAG